MTDTDSKPPEFIEQIKQATGVAYDIDEDTASYTATKNDTDHFIDFVVFLFDEGRITQDDLPYVPGYGKIRYLLNDNPVHQDGRDMSRPEKITENVYLETNHDSHSKKRYTKQMIDDFVLE
jgi:hypothetical protein